MDLMYADISVAQLVMVVVVHVPVDVLQEVHHIRTHRRGSQQKGKDLPSATFAPGLISKLPGHDRRLVNISADERFDVVLVSSLEKTMESSA